MAAATANAQDVYADLAPVLAQRCVMCHAGQAAPLGLRLDTFDALMKGSQRGPVVRPGNAAASELIRRLKGQSLPRMPMTGPPFLSDAEIARFERWIAAGTPRGDVAAAVTAPPAPPPAAARPAPGEPVTWVHVAPIFATRCAKCHTDEGQMGAPPEGYRLTSLAAAIDASDRARIVPGHPDASELVRRVRGQARPRMPFDGPPWLTDEQIRLIEDWVAQGARDAEGRPSTMPAGAAVRLHGVLDASRGLDGLDLAIGPGTRIDKSPAPGSHVEVRGRLDAAGHVRVERLRSR